MSYFIPLQLSSLVVSRISFYLSFSLLRFIDLETIYTKQDFPTEVKQITNNLQLGKVPNREEQGEEGEGKGKEEEGKEEEVGE